MPKRKIIRIDEEKCTGCGLCVPNCQEGALQIIDKKARLVKEIYCDGLGACLGHCPEGAITIEEREADSFDEEATKKHLEEINPDFAIAKSARRADRLNPIGFNLARRGNPKQISNAKFGIKKKKDKKLPCGCPGTMVKMFEAGTSKPDAKKIEKSVSQLGNWPVQLKLVPVEAPYLKNADLLIAADCTAFSYPDFHQDLLKGKALLIACPKLDEGDLYIEKLAEIFRVNNLKSLTIVHMEVPCCFGLNHIVSEALKLSGMKIPLTEVTIGVRGDIK